MNSMEVICLESKAFYELVEQVVVERMMDQKQEKPKWISGDEAMSMLKIYREAERAFSVYDSVSDK